MNGGEEEAEPAGVELQGLVQQTAWRRSSANLNILAQERLQQPSVRSRMEEQRLGNTL